MTILVLGATSAIAQAAARIWAARGEELVLVARNAVRLEAVAGDLRTRGGKVVTLLQDLDDASLYPRLVQPVDLVLLAQAVLGDPAETDPAAVERVLRTNLLGPAQLLTLIGEVLQPGACIVALSSVAGDRGRAKSGIYGASKAGLDAFLSALRQKLVRRGVRVVTVKPGFVDTPMTAGFPKTKLFASAESVGRGIVRAAASGSDVVYLPWYWRFLMVIIRAIPERLFKKMSF